MWSHDQGQKADIVVVDEVKKETMMVDVAVPRDTRVCDKGRQKIKKFPDYGNWKNQKNQKIKKKSGLRIRLNILKTKFLVMWFLF